MNRSRLSTSTRRRVPLSTRTVIHALLLGVLLGGSGFAAWSSPAGAQADQLSASAQRQIAALIAEKDARTPAQRKIASQLLYAARQNRGEAVARGVSRLTTGVEVDSNGLTAVELRATVSDALLEQLRALGAEITTTYPRYDSIYAKVPLAQLEAIASNQAVRAIALPAQPVTRSTPRADLQYWQGAGQPVIVKRDQLRDTIAAVLAQQPRQAKTNTSEGDQTHRADEARALGATGAGINIGVLSDGIATLAQRQASGDLPPNITVLPGQAGPPNGDEGTAMLEIVYDLAPGANLFFATAFEGQPGFADNIRALAAAGCTIIVDDIGYFNESPFQKGQTNPTISSAGVISQAVNEVAAAGVTYLSAIGNDGNLNDGTASVYESEYRDGGASTSPPGNLHDFDPGPANVATNQIVANFPAGSRRPIVLKWADPLGGSTNDYDLFIVNSASTTVIAASTEIQNGGVDPLEGVVGDAAAPGNRIVIIKKSTAQPRFLHLHLFGGQPQFATNGSGYGHPMVEGAFAIAATPAAEAGDPSAPDGPFPNPFNSSNVVETFSSDGPRRWFFNPDGTPITPGNFGATGGQLVQKPDHTAADGVSTATPGFDPFYGTSAAAPHAAAIAGLIKSVNPAYNPTQVRQFFNQSAIDIEAPGVDQDSGAGIIDAFVAVQAAQAPTDITLTSFTAVGGDEGITVSWSTSRENNTWGYNLYRSADSNRANATRVTQQRIPAKGSQGGSYSYVDTTADPGRVYYYWLEETELDGSTNDYGPIAVERPGVLVRDGLFLPLISR